MRFFRIAFIALILLPSFSILNPVSAQQNWCGEREMSQRYRNEHPEQLDEILAAEKWLNDNARLTENQRGPRSNKVIPVVFHIIHLNGPENIADFQVLDQIRILNEDYNAQNADLADVIPQFTSIIGNPSIEFRLAKKDPNGNPTNGIDRIYSSATNNGGQSAKLNPWPRNMYLNIWVVKQWNSSIPNGVLAYSQLPSTVNSPQAADIDGVICLSQYIGSVGTGSIYYSRTITHEVGHYLNLEHTWGPSNDPGLSTNCNGDDGVSDTPLCIGSSSCDLTLVSCGSLDNIQNQMEYSFCSNMFTNGQANRMVSTLNSSVAQRNQLSSAANLSNTGVSELNLANFSKNRITICEGDTINFSDQSEYDATNWSWTFPGGQNTNSSLKDPEIIYESAGLYDVSLAASNSSTTKNETKIGYIMVNPVQGKFVPVTDNFSTVNSLNHENWYSNNVNNDGYEFRADGSNGHSGGNCVKMDNYGNLFKTQDELLTTTYDLSIFSSVNISFKTAYAQANGSDVSRFTMYISKDCGETWTPRWAAIGPNLASAPMTSSSFVPSGNSDWKTSQVSNLSGNVLTQNSQIKFVFENNNGNNLYFDDFRITGTYTKTAQLKAPFDGAVSRPNNQIIYWKAIGNIDSYEYQLDSDPGFASANLQTGINTALSINEGPDTQYAPSTLTNGETYYWRVRLIINGQPQVWSETWSFTVAANGVSTQDLLVEKYAVKVYPNPFHETGYISFKLDQGSPVTISLIDMVGKERLLIHSGYLGTGSHIYTVQNPNMSSGVYLVRITVNGNTLFKKIIIQ